ncbi:MAG: hypothetical protein RL654_673 [Pseudomonadota bacterium]|jgi:polar amino acid transport system permease protein
MISLDFGAVLEQWPLLARGVALTVALTALSATLGTAVGVACAWMRVWGPAAWRWPVVAYVELVRNTPFIVQLFFVFFGLPAAGVKLSPEAAALMAMTVNLGAYAAEIVRAGLEATPRGQIEAARSLALDERQVFLRVVLPPALGRVWPALVGQIIIVMLGSSVCGQIAAAELSYQANLIQSRNFRAFEAFLIGAAIYLGLSLLLRRLLDEIGPRWIFGRRAATGR